MAATSPCTPCCAETQTVNVPGIQGPAGPTGPTGATGATGPAGAPGISALDNESVYAAGTVYTLLATGGALVQIGGTDLKVTIPSLAGETWLLTARVRYDYAAWRSTTKTITTKLRRTNNTPGDITNGSTGYVLVDTSAAAVTYTLGDVLLPSVVYTASGTNDVIELWASLSFAASLSGTMTAVEAELVALKIANAP